MESVEAIYRRLFADKKARMEAVRRWHIGLGYAKLADFLAGVIAAAVLIRMHGPLSLLLIPLLIFVALIVAHDRVIRRLAKYVRVTEFYARGLARIEDQWAGTGETGERFFDAAHPYARDLDLFGKGSLFELLCTARTRMGEETLAQWLLAAAAPEEVRARQVAVAELRDRVALREQLFATGEDVRAGVHPEPLAGWGDGEPMLRSRALPWVLAVLAAAWVASIVFWGLTRNWDLALLMSLINYAVSYWLQRQVSESAGAVEKAAPDLKLLAEVLEIVEREPLQAERLKGLRARLDTHHVPASRAVAKLERIYDWLEDRRNGFVAIFNAFVFYTAQLTMAAERWRGRFGPGIREWLQATGEFEALAALAGYAYEHPADVLPEVCTETPCFDADRSGTSATAGGEGGWERSASGLIAAADRDQRAEHGGQEHVSSRSRPECGVGTVRSAGAGKAAADVAPDGGRVDLRARFARRGGVAVLCGDSAAQGPVGSGSGTTTAAVPAG